MVIHLVQQIIKLHGLKNRPLSSGPAWTLKGNKLLHLCTGVIPVISIGFHVYQFFFYLKACSYFVILKAQLSSCVADSSGSISYHILRIFWRRQGLVPDIRRGTSSSTPRMLSHWYYLCVRIKGIRGPTLLHHSATTCICSTSRGKCLYHHTACNPN